MNRPMIATDPTSLDHFTRAYIECALWSSPDYADESGGEPLDQNYTLSDIAPEALASIVADCAKFQRENEEAIYEWPKHDAWGQAGHDFWLTRNGHGEGFWDGDWPEPQASRLTAASKAFGECDLYVGDDGRVYV